MCIGDRGLPHEPRVDIDDTDTVTAINRVHGRYCIPMCALARAKIKTQCVEDNSESQLGSHAGNVHSHKSCRNVHAHDRIFHVSLQLRARGYVMRHRKYTARSPL